MRGGEDIERGGHGGGWMKKMTKGILLSIQNYNGTFLIRENCNGTVAIN
jgi:hypothetical protein